MVTAWQAPRCQGKSTGQDASLQDVVLKASQAYTSGNYEACLEHCMIGQSLLCVSAPQSHHRRYQIDLLLLTAVAYFELGQYAKSVAYNDAAVVLDPSLPEAQANLASGLSRLGQLDLAIMYYQVGVARSGEWERTGAHSGWRAHRAWVVKVLVGRGGWCDSDFLCAPDCLPVEIHNPCNKRIRGPLAPGTAVCPAPEAHHRRRPDESGHRAAASGSPRSWSSPRGCHASRVGYI